MKKTNRIACILLFFLAFCAVASCKSAENGKNSDSSNVENSSSEPSNGGSENSSSEPSNGGSENSSGDSSELKDNVNWGADIFENVFAFSSSSYTVLVGGTISMPLNVRAIADYDESLLQIEVSDEDILRPEAGSYYALSEGEVRVTAKYNGGQLTASAQVTVCQPVAAEEVAAFSSQAFVVQGRAYETDGALTFDNVNSGLEYWFYGTESIVKFSVPSSYSGNDLYVCVYVDDSESGNFFPLNNYGADVEYSVTGKLSKGLHKVVLLKATEQSLWTAKSRSMVISEVVQDENCTIVKRRDRQNRMRIDFYGDSITCGLSNLGASTNYSTSEENGTLTYAALTGRAMDALVSCVSYSGITIGCEYNLGNTTMLSLWQSYSALYTERYAVAADYVVINLGTNDASALAQGETTAEEIKTAAKDLLAAMRTAYGSDTKIIWAYGMMGEETLVKTQIQAAMTELGGESSGYYYLSLDQKFAGGAGGHPLVKGHEAAAETLTAYLRGLQGE